MRKTKPSLFGINSSNRDFTQQASWGKNQFNSSFPASLTAYMGYKNLEPVYLTLSTKHKDGEENTREVEHNKIAVSDVFGLPYSSAQLHYHFEKTFTPYEVLVNGKCPSVDLVTINLADSTPLRPLEVKLTALPDNSTYKKDDKDYGCELVVRPQSIGYLALSIAQSFNRNRSSLVDSIHPLVQEWSEEDWLNAIVVRPKINEFVTVLNNFLDTKNKDQTPFLLQPIWKTKGKSSILAEQCFDVFVWSNHALTRLFIDTALNNKNRANITRNERTVIWLIKIMTLGKLGK